ncbi:Hypothetical protein R9X50_00129400 [Acrodontium crateriforme]|uniref:BZIP domain-containing protein n=1 Tax=Acrodontium crateriforme TaxID=150365 RepID=A0AAQ3LYW0_9PEZI|nr:Hypothetical protein R9X50_00129400 [Acrodontium crateriforme]
MTAAAFTVSISYFLPHLVLSFPPPPAGLSFQLLSLLSIPTSLLLAARCFWLRCSSVAAPAASNCLGALPFAPPLQMNAAPDHGMAAPSKVEVDRDGTPSSIESTPDRDAGGEASREPTQPQKRKGGRKPIYATSEERKQRNRQAQAAFRERRTEYIKQLEATIKQNDEALSTLQQSHRTAADECLMLRYKNSLLERILLEKGIDVQAELQIKTGSPVMGGGFAHPGSQVAVQQQPLQRATIQRQHARRSAGQNFLPKLAPGQSNPDMNFPTASPQGVPTPSSHASSPTNTQMRSPMNTHQGGTTPSTSAGIAQPQHQQFHHNARSSQPQPNQAFFAASHQSPQTQRRPLALQNTGSAANQPSHYGMTAAAPMSAGTGSANPSMAAYYPSPFQKHIDQLEQEYDTEQTRSLLDHPEQEPTSNPSPHQLQGAYPPQFDHAHHPQTNEFYPHQMGGQQPQRQAPQGDYPSQGPVIPVSQGPDGMSQQFQQMGHVIDPNDPMLDADPFGLSASMHYPTSYSVMEQQQQQTQAR